MDSIRLTLVGNFEIHCWNNYAVMRHLFRVLLVTLDRMHLRWKYGDVR